MNLEYDYSRPRDIQIQERFDALREAGGYTFVGSDDPKELVLLVNEMAADGYEPLGAPVATVHSAYNSLSLTTSHSEYWRQFMVKR
jgi:hypothetical protein